MDKETKKIYLDLIDSLGVIPEFKEVIRKFIETYDGSNPEETKIFLAHLFAFIYSVQAHLIKSEALDKIEESHEKLKVDLNVMVEELEAVTKGRPVPYPVV